jgi:hypothetical protein
LERALKFAIEDPRHSFGYGEPSSAKRSISERKVSNSQALFKAFPNEKIFHIFTGGST